MKNTLRRCRTAHDLLRLATALLTTRHEAELLGKAVEPLCRPEDNPGSELAWASFAQNLTAMPLRGGQACASMRRVGSKGDGGKVLCERVGRLPTAFGKWSGAVGSDSNASEGGLVVSVGSNSDFGFEAGVHALAPASRIETWDGAQPKEMGLPLAALRPPPFVTLHERNVGPFTWEAYKSEAAVDVLKMDCGGCEWMALGAWVNNLCTQQVVVEVHFTPVMLKAKGPAEALLRHMSASHTLFHAEPNMRCGYKQTTTRVCLELAWVRTSRC